MEMSSHDRHATLPPLPSLSRRLRARLTALWFLAAALGRRGIDALARHARRGIEIVRARRAPSPVAAGPESGPRTTELLTCLRGQQQRCLGAVAVGEVHPVSRSRPTVTAMRPSGHRSRRPRAGAASDGAYRVTLRK